MFPSYPPQAKTRTEVVEALQKKKRELNNEIAFFDIGLRKIQGLQEGSFYELAYREEATFFVQCRKFGRDHVEFRILTCNKDYAKSRHPDAKLSLIWHWEWETTPVDVKNAVLYISHAVKTKHYDNLLKGKYRSLKPRS
jgi:hypothetical protein